MAAALPFLLASLQALAATAVVYLGVAFINAQILPGVLTDVYTQISAFWRGMIALVVLNTPASFMIAGVYRLVDPALAGVLLIAALAVVLTAKALLLGVDGLGWRALAAGLATTCALIWLAWELGGKGH